MATTVHDVAAYIIKRQGGMSSMKLQKLVYYSQAWHLVWEERPLFREHIEAWANGPVVYELYDRHRGAFFVDSWPTGDPSHLSRSEQATIDAVLEGYGGLDGRKLSRLTHDEDPWRNARGELPPTARSNREITLNALASYYGAVEAASEAVPVDELDWSDWESWEDASDGRVP